MSSKKTKIILPEVLHKVRIRFYQNKYPNKDDIVLAKLKTCDDNIGYYMNLIEYENKEALIVFKEIARSARKKIVLSTFNEDVNYPLVVSERIVRPINPDADFQTDSEDSDDESIMNDYDVNDPSLDVKIDLSNKVLSEIQKNNAMEQYSKYKKIHDIVHTYGSMLKLNQMTTQEEADNINKDDYKDYLERLAVNTIWKYPKEKAIEIFTIIRNDMNTINEYFNEGDNTEIFKQAIMKNIPKTKYMVTCNLKMQTLDIDGINILRNVMENFQKQGITAQVISAPEYLIKMEMYDLEKIKSTLNDVLLETTKYMAEHTGFIQIVSCYMSNNVSDTINAITLPMMETV